MKRIYVESFGDDVISKELQSMIVSSLVARSSSGGFVARHMGTSDSSVNTETINEARVAVRQVNSEGDVIWTSTQESKGAKYKGSSADVADRCIQLLRDVEKLEHARQD